MLVVQFNIIKSKWQSIIQSLSVNEADKRLEDTFIQYWNASVFHLKSLKPGKRQKRPSDKSLAILILIDRCVDQAQSEMNYYKCIE